MIQDTQIYPTISHKKCFVPNVNVLDFVGDFFGGIIKARGKFLYMFFETTSDNDGPLPNLNGV
jgi:hypothetical protein